MRAAVWLLAAFGAFILLLAVAASFGIGNFVLIYGPQKTVCAVDPTSPESKP